MSIELEDNVGDIIGKAQRGLQISDSELTQKSGVSRQTLNAVREGASDDEEAIEKIASVLKLAAKGLIGLTRGRWRPKEIPKVQGLAQFTTDYGGMKVNSYLVWHPTTKDAVAFDTGADCTPMLKQARHLKVKLILLTHAHSDH